MTKTLDDMTNKKAKAELSVQEQVAEDLVRRARASGNPGGSYGRSVWGTYQDWVAAGLVR